MKRTVLLFILACLLAPAVALSGGFYATAKIVYPADNNNSTVVQTTGGASSYTALFKMNRGGIVTAWVSPDNVTFYKWAGVDNTSGFSQITVDNTTNVAWQIPGNLSVFPYFRVNNATNQVDNVSITVIGTDLPR